MKFSELDGARIGLWGLGSEASEFARVFAARYPGQSIECASDDSLEGLPESLPQATRWIAPGDRAREFAQLDLVIRAPGVSIYRDDLRELKALGLPVTTSTSLWLADGPPAPVIAVSGTKGKSTTSALAAHLLTGLGRRAELAGNIGRPAIGLVDQPVPDFYVLELSSYQTADLETGAEIVVLTSLHPEHLDWHTSTERYYADKLRLASLPGVEKVLANAEDRTLVEHLGATPFERFGGAGRFGIEDDRVLVDGREAVSAEQLGLRGRHNLLNACAALAAVDAAGVDFEPETAGKILASFEALPHRLQKVESNDGITWIDDSISTTPETAIAALESIAGEPLILIAGGFDREQDYAELGREIAARGVQLIAMPTTGPRIAEAALAAGCDRSRVHIVDSLQLAVDESRALAAAGGTIILSPAAPSYDAFSSFVERGRQFRRLIEDRAG